jgi:hypothetical protein
MDFGPKNVGNRSAAAIGGTQSESVSLSLSLSLGIHLLTSTRNCSALQLRGSTCVCLCYNLYIYTRNIFHLNTCSYTLHFNRWIIIFIKTIQRSEPTIFTISLLRIFFRYLGDYYYYYNINSKNHYLCITKLNSTASRVGRSICYNSKIWKKNPKVKLPASLLICI